MNLAESRRGFPHDRIWLFRFAVFCVVATVFLLLAGAAVKSTESGLSVPDWPLSFGQVMPPMEGGVFYEHGHRMVATAVGALTVILAFWFWYRDPRPGLRRLGWIALAMVIVQGVLGGLTVLLELPALVSTLHACLAQAFLMVVAFMALSVSRGWNTDPALDRPRSSLVFLATATTAAIYIQLILGAVTRHLEAALVIPDFPLVYGGLVPPAFTTEVAVHYAHRVGALVVTLLAAATFAAAWRTGRQDFRGPAGWMMVLVAAQITLGALIVFSRRDVLPTTAHVVVGALILTASTVLTARGWRFARGSRALETRQEEAA